jgi:dihydropteroate synthase
MQINFKNRAMPMIMGIVNATPDSFSDGGKFSETENALNHALKLIKDGADIIDIGGESTRPGAKEVSVSEEISRIVPLIEKLRAQSDILISIDTRKPEVATAAVAAGANIWNDVSALTFSENSIETAIKLGVPVILMHSGGDPETMQNSPAYKDVCTDILSFMAARIGACIAAGMTRENIIIDVGIGFGKTLEHNLSLLSRHNRFQALGCPGLLGASRKSLIGKIDESATDPMSRLGGSLAIAMFGAENGADIVRVHDVYETHQAFLVRAAINARKAIDY